MAAYDRDGTLLGFGKIVRDASAERIRRRTEDMLESISDAFYAVDADFRFT
jgi:hypothetical protein